MRLSILPVPLLKLYKLKPYCDFRETLTALKEKTETILNRQLNELAIQPNSVDRPKSFVEQWLQKGKLSKDEIVAEACGIFVAAFDGVSYTMFLSPLFYFERGHILFHSNTALCNFHFFLQCYRNLLLQGSYYVHGV